MLCWVRLVNLFKNNCIPGERTNNKVRKEQFNSRNQGNKKEKQDGNDSDYCDRILEKKYEIKWQNLSEVYLCIQWEFQIRYYFQKMARATIEER